MGGAVSDRVRTPVLPLLWRESMLACGLAAVATQLLGADSPSSGSSLLPQAEIGALRFLEKHPEYDGRGVVIAVLDTGVDPGAAGLQTTPDGRPKIIDLIDGSGAGDVDTSTVVELTDGKLTGLSGRSLQPDPNWRNPSGKYHLGLKPGCDLFPEELLERMQQRKREVWEEHQRSLEALLQQSLINWRAVHDSPTDDQRLELAELQVRLEQLREIGASFEDPGPTFDCVVFHDGHVWRAVVDTDEDGDLRDEMPLTNYRLERGHGTFGGEALLNFAVNIFQDGNLLSIVTDANRHGTHVAGIAAACFPNQPELQGIAPGAQIVSVKYGPNRLRGGNMETGRALIRSLAAVRELRCDILNLSFAEAVARPNQGRLIELLSEIVEEDGVLLIAAVANQGPGLSTVHAPGGTSTAALGVGAYLSPAMMEPFSTEARAEALFQFSSRGPTADGAWGVSVCAPGAAVSSVPNWSLSLHEQMVGTSMATPSVSGAAALILSGLKAEKLNYSPATIRRALENTARPIPEAEVFGQGRGLVQVDAAFDLGRRLSSLAGARPRLEATVMLWDLPEGRGVYLREPETSRHRRDGVARVKALFPQATDSGTKLSYQARFRLESTEPWVRVAKSLFLTHGTGDSAGSSFALSVDPTGLETGVHEAEIRGFEEGREDLGPAFRIPVVVVRPLRFEPDAPPAWVETIPLKAGAIDRRFFAVPAGATWAELRVRSTGLTVERPVVIQGLQLIAGQVPQRIIEKIIALRDGRSETVQFPVTALRTLELLLAQLPDPATHGQEVELSLEFRGVVPTNPEIFFAGAAQAVRVQATSVLRSSSVDPKASLTTRRRIIRPDHPEFCLPDLARESLPAGRRLHRLILTYQFQMDEAGSATPVFPALSQRLYDAELGDQLWMVFDSARRLIAIGENTMKPEGIRCDPGLHTLRFQASHERLELLEQLKSLPLFLDQALDPELPLTLHADPDGPLTGPIVRSGVPAVSDWVAVGDTTVRYLAAPPAEQVRQADQAGDLLLGTIRYEPEPCPVGYPLTFLIPPPPRIVETPPPADERTIEHQLADERRDFEMAQLDRLGDEVNTAHFETRFSDLQARYPDRLPLLVARLHRLDDGRTQQWRSVAEAADEIICRINTHGLAVYFGQRHREHATVRQIQDEKERERDALADALYRKARALQRLCREATDHHRVAPSSDPPVDSADLGVLFDETISELQKWVDTTGENYVAMQVAWERHHGRLGQALRLVREQIRNRPADRALREQQTGLLTELGWDHCAQAEERWMWRRFPRDYTAF